MSLLARIVAALLAMVPLPAAAQPASHPLAGKIVDTRSGVVSAISDLSLVPRLFPCGAITLLGEVHDNGDHHRMRASLIDVLADRPSAGACSVGGFVFEQISADQRPGLDAFREFTAKVKRLPVATDLFSSIDWDKSGWPAADLYRPLFDAVLATRRPIVPGHPDRAITRKVAREGIAALAPDAVSKLDLAQPLPADLQDDLLGELEASHCGLMPKSAFGNMAVAQRYRDAAIADAALTAAAEGGAVVIAGNGHIRTDRGIPFFLRQRAPDKTVVAVAFVETEAGKDDPAAYGPRDPSGKPAADFIAFAPPAGRNDPCEQMRKHMKK